MVRLTKSTKIMGLTVVLVMLAAAVVGAAVGDTFYDVSYWRSNLDDNRRRAYVAGVYDAVQMIATGSGGNPVRIAQCLDRRGSKISEVTTWVEGLVATRSPNINVASIILVNACN